MRQLLVVRAGDQSLHQGWLSPTPEFDLFVSYYGDQPGRFEDEATRYETRKGVKWPALTALAHEHTQFLSEYDYVGLIDDDVRATATDWNGVFRMGRMIGADVFQPALTVNSYLNWSHMRRDDDPQVVARTVGMVEQMAVIFSRQAFARVIGTFAKNITGWGMEAYWLRRLPGCRAAVIDGYAVQHTRMGGSGPMYAFYRENRINHEQDAQTAARLTGLEPWSTPPLSSLRLSEVEPLA